MPTQLPKKLRAQIMRTNHDYGAEESAEQRKLTVKTTDWLAIWALSIAISAVLIAGLAYFTDGDADGAALILTGAAIVMAGALYASAAPRETGSSQSD
jgi:hypothetical protein